MINPYFGYILGFVASILFYQLGWSKLFPPLSVGLLSFLLSTFIVHVVLGLIWKKRVSFPDIREDGLKPEYVTFFLCLLWVAEFFYGGIPIVEVLMQTDFDYRQFGIPMLHVFVVTFASFYAVVLFHLFITSGKKKFLILFLVNLAPSLLIYNRAMMLFILTSAAFIYLHHKKISPKIVLTGIPAIIVFLFLFGVMGNLRQVAHLRSGYGSYLFFEIIEPTDRFKNSSLPGEFMWGYAYLSSPLANLQTNVQTEQRNVAPRGFLQFITNEMIPDFLSKRINRLLDWTPVEDSRIPGPFNAATVYSKSYSYLGWLGLFLMAGFIVVVPWIYWWAMPENEYKLVGMAILSSMYLLLVFDNTIRFTGFSFQLVYPILYPIIENRLVKAKSRP